MAIFALYRRRYPGMVDGHWVYSPRMYRLESTFFIPSCGQWRRNIHGEFLNL